MSNTTKGASLREQKAKVIPLTGVQSGYIKNAKVVAVHDKSVTLVYKSVSDHEKCVEGRVAFSCLVTPLPGDTVVCIQNDAGMHIVLAILDRVDSQDMTLNFPADASFRSASGDLGFFADKKVSILARDSLTCAAEKTIHKSKEATISYQNMIANGESVTVRYKAMHVLCDLMSTVAKNAFNKFNHYVRRSSESDQISAAYMDRKVDGLYSMNSKTTLMVSKKDTKIDGERIHMG